MFEPIELAHRLEKNVHDDIDIIEHDPMAVVEALDCDRTLVLQFHPFANAAPDRLYLDVGAAGRDDEIIGNRIEMIDLQDDQVVGLFLERCFGRDERLL